MKNLSIVSGNFSANGNFSGYTAFGERLFIHKTQMATFGLKDLELPKFPFFCIGDVKEIGQLDENSKPKMNADGTPLTIKRLQALSVFPSEEAIRQAHVNVKMLDINIKKAVVEAASAAGLSEAGINALLELA